MSRLPATIAEMILVTAAMTFPLEVHAQRGSELSTAAIAAELTPATVTIIAIDSRGDTLAQGSGFIVRSDGTIVTNWHVLNGASSAVVVLSTRERFDRVSFVVGDQDADIAVIKIPGYDLPIVETRSSVPAVGDRVITIGSPLGLSNTVGEGIVSAHRLVAGKTLVQISAPISHGSSGGVVADSKGRVFAVSTAMLEDGQQLNFAVPVRYALGLLAGAPAPQPLSLAFAQEPENLVTGQQASSTQASGVPTTHPLSTLRGVFFVEDHWTTATATGEKVGFLVLGDDIRLLMLGNWNAEAETYDNPRTVAVQSFIIVPDGRVAAEMAWVTFDGFQTDNGFWLSGLSQDSAEVSQYEITGERYMAELSEAMGLYRVTTRTEYCDPDCRGTFVNWSGEAGVLVHSDSIWIDMTLRNSSGGSTGIRGGAKLGDDGRFRIENERSGTLLVGTLRAGVIVANWRDKRDGDSRFEGSLRAERI